MEENLRKEMSRLSCVDLARGIGILAIVYGHASRDVGLLARAVYSFHVVLFVLLSGYVYRQKDSFVVHLKTSARRLLVPYVIWSFISMGIYLMLGKIAAEALGSELYSLGDNLIFMLKGLSIGNAALWYLPFLFTSGLLMYGYIHLLQRWNPEKPGEKVTAVAFPALFSLVTLGIYSRYQYRCPIDFPFGINNACFLFVFFFLGLVLRRTVTYMNSSFSRAWRSFPRMRNSMDAILLSE